MEYRSKLSDTLVRSILLYRGAEIRGLEEAGVMERETAIRDSRYVKEINELILSG